MSSNQMVRSGISEKTIRIDKLLWFLRFARNRSLAKKMTEKGYVRLNGRRVNRAHLLVRPNDIIAVPMGREVRVVRVISLPVRRGGASTAQTCYEILETG